MSPDHRAPARATVPAVVAVTIGVAVMLAGFALLSVLTDRPYAYFSKEPAEVFGEPRYVGWAALLTTLVAAAGAASAAFAGLLVRLQRGRSDEAGFLLGMSAFAWILVLDDMLQLHDWIVPRFVPGVGERTLFASYALVLVAVLWRWGRHVIARTELSIALLAAVGLGVSLAFDLFVPNSIAFYHLTEDGAKLFGLAMLTLYLVRTGLQFALAPGARTEEAAPALHERQLVPDDVVPALMPPPRRPVDAGTAPSPRRPLDTGAITAVPWPRAESDPLHSPGS